MSETTKEQILEYLEQTVRDLKSGKLTKEDVQTLITRPKYEPKERLVRSLLKRAREAVTQIPQPFERYEAMTELAIAYCVAEQDHEAYKTVFQIGNADTQSIAYLGMVNVLCERGNIKEARKSAKLMHGYWVEKVHVAQIAIAEKTGDEKDYPTSDLFRIELAIAVSRAKTANISALQELRNRTEKGMSWEYWEVLVALAKEYARQQLFPQSIAIMQSLPDVHVRFQVALVIANARKLVWSRHAMEETLSREMAVVQNLLENDCITCGTILNSIYSASPKNTFSYARDLLKIVAISSNQNDFQLCHDIVEKLPFGREQSQGYAALALTYAMRNDIPTARQFVNKIVDPFYEAKALIGIARAVLINK